MSLDDLASAAQSRIGKMVYSGLVTIFLSAITWIGNNIDAHLRNQDNQLAQHGAALSRLEEHVSILADGQEKTWDKLNALAQSQADAALAAAAVKQRLDDKIEQDERDKGKP